LEERTSKYAQEKSALEEKNKAKDNELQELKADLDAAKKVLSQNEQVIQGLKEELQKVAKPKETPQENSRQASADGKKPKK
jgi:predicted  nucleic acid-binding Zn-ribbon protein